MVGGGGNLKRGGHGKRGMCVRMIEASSSAARAGFFTFCRFSLFIIIGPQPYDLALRFVLYYGGRLVLRFYLSSLSSSVLRSFYLSPILRRSLPPILERYHHMSSRQRPEGGGGASRKRWNGTGMSTHVSGELDLS